MAPAVNSEHYIDPISISYACGGLHLYPDLNHPFVPDEQRHGRRVDPEDAAFLPILDLMDIPNHSGR